MRLLLLSNSTNYQEAYLGWPGEYVKDFLGQERIKVLFIPYAGVTVSLEDYTNKVAGVFADWGYDMEGIHEKSDPLAAVNAAQAIAIGGGNTFRLLEVMYKDDLVDAIRARAEAGIPMIGWSAGSNVCGPSICTTNDMPIVEPPSFTALNLVSFQINPHFTEKTIPGHGGESRSMRLMEYLEINPGVRVAGLPENCLLRLEGEKIQVLGKGMKIFEKGLPVREIADGAFLSLNLE